MVLMYDTSSYCALHLYEVSNTEAFQQGSMGNIHVKLYEIWTSGLVVA